ncbi:hypothetical protein L3X38_010986 [Prunus dulcis]|uniref:RNase H type-1 domain-containing protein n=1 Tax=Prunus dulcis TaxID=3755 RepID=A0AAD4WGP3_PRUDU|nr:hypothetical protein L3X38_010986 [Prunus dulcis]
MVVRDSEGGFCKAVALCAPNLLSVLAIELYALKFGLSFAIDASFLPLIVEIDSLFATQLTLKDEVCVAAEGVLVEDIRLLLMCHLLRFTMFPGLLMRILIFGLICVEGKCESPNIISPPPLIK